MSVWLSIASIEQSPAANAEGRPPRGTAIPFESQVQASDLDRAAIDEEFGAINVACLVRGQKQHGPGDALASGPLVRVLPEWRGQQGIVHLVFTTRRGLPPAVRALIDHLAAGFPRDVVGASG